MGFIIFILIVFFIVGAIQKAKENREFSELYEYQKAKEKEQKKEHEKWERYRKWKYKKDHPFGGISYEEWKRRNPLKIYE